MSQFFIFIALMVAVGFGIHACENTDSAKKYRADKAAQELADKKPRLYSESPDGCKVYAFKADRWLYFSRCPDSKTATTTTWKKCVLQGKINSCKEESSTVEGQP